MTFVWMTLEDNIYIVPWTRFVLCRWETLLGERLSCTIVVVAAVSDEDDNDMTSMFSVHSSNNCDSGSGGWDSRLEMAA